MYVFKKLLQRDVKTAKGTFVLHSVGAKKCLYRTTT